MPNGLTYKDAGVDIDAGNALVDAIKPLAKATSRSGADVALGGFGAFFDLKAAGFIDPVLVACTDGVGTKLMVAQAARQHHGIADGCKLAGCALIGGETAEMPGMYAPGHYDLAGFAVGAVERDQVLTGDSVAAGDIILGLKSSGFHSNGYSLVRRAVEMSSVGYDDAAPFANGTTLGQALLAPTRIYVKSCLAAVRGGHVKALAHITGGGFIDNIPRVLPKNLGAEVDASATPLPPMMKWLAKTAEISNLEMARTFNCGIGMAVVVAEENADAAQAILAEHGETVLRIGRIVELTEGPQVKMLNLENWSKP